MDLEEFKQAQRTVWATGDYVPVGRMLEPAARELVTAAGVAAGMDVLDAAFDVVLSSFGAIFAPRHELVATEMARVCRPGGTVAMTAWIPGEGPERLTAVLRDRLPDLPAVGLPSHMWDEAAAALRAVLADDNDASDGTYRASWPYLRIIGERV